MSLTPFHRFVTIAIVAALGGLAGCSLQPAAPALQPPADQAVQFAESFAEYRTDTTYEPSPDRLAARSSLVIEGNITRITDGRVFGTSVNDPVARHSLVFVMEIRRVLHGKLPAGSENHVYVELPGSAGLSAPSLDQAAPKSSAVLLYLRPAATTADTAIATPDAGRPAGQPLFQPASAQGFVIAAQGKVVQVLSYTEFDGATLEGFAPGAARFPAASRVGIDG